MGLPCDWQIDKQKISERGEYLLETGTWSDCKFIVGQEPYQETVHGHKLLLAMSSPVFEAMFFGSIAEKNDPIPITDIRPEAFKALLRYIYTDYIKMSSFDLACELCYCAKKYLLPILVNECTKYIWSVISPDKVCRAYEFAKLHDEADLMNKCLNMISARTSEVLKNQSFEEIELETLLTILDEQKLKLISELELFTALERWAKAECVRKLLDPEDSECLKSVIGNALSKIRFLSLTPSEFAKGPGMSPLLIQDEAFTILMKILCPGNAAPIPDGFSLETQRRMLPEMDFSSNCVMHRRPGINAVNVMAESINESMSIRIESKIRDQNGQQRYCLRSVINETRCINHGVLDCTVAFTVDKDIVLLGVQVPTQVATPETMHNLSNTYTEVLYAHVLDSNGARLTYAHFSTKVSTRTLVEITFNRPVYIKKNMIYRLGVAFNKAGLYPLGVGSQYMSSDSVFFTFGIGTEEDNVLDGLIRGIVFSTNSAYEVDRRKRN